MVDYAQLLDLDTSKLTGAAESAHGLSTSMSARGEEVASAAQIPPGMWGGDDASAASAMLSLFPDPLYLVSDDASHSRGVLDDLVTALTDAQELLRDAQDQAFAGGLTIGPDGTVVTPVVDDAALAADQARIAQQVRDLIDSAIEAANMADDVAVAALDAAGQGLKRFFGLPDNMSPGNPEMGLWIMNNLYGRAGDLANGLANGPLGRLAAVGPNGMPLTDGQRFMAALRGQFTAAGPEVAGLHSNLSRFGRAAGAASGVLGMVGAGVSQYNKDAGNPDMGNAERYGRTAYRAAFEGGGAWAGAAGGAQLGMAVGSFAGPVGTVVGTVAGGIIGGFVGSEVGGAFVDSTIEDFGNDVETISNGLGAAGRAVGDAVDYITPW